MADSSRLFPPRGWVCDGEGLKQLRPDKILATGKLEEENGVKFLKWTDRLQVSPPKPDRTVGREPDPSAVFVNGPDHGVPPVSLALNQVVILSLGRSAYS